jgi:hypothetical protein
MPRERKKPDLSPEVVGLNPLAETLEIEASKKAYQVKNKFGDADEIRYELEAQPYTKVYAVKGGRKSVDDLELRSKELYLYLLYNLDTGQDVVWLDREWYMERMRIKSVNTYKDAIRGLCEGLFIYPHSSLKDVYWINPAYFFRGSRLSKYPSKVKYKAKKQ